MGCGSVTKKHPDAAWYLCQLVVPEGRRILFNLLLGLGRLLHEAPGLLGQDGGVLHDGGLRTQFGQLPEGVLSQLLQGYPLLRRVRIRSMLSGKFRGLQVRVFLNDFKQLKIVPKNPTGPKEFKLVS